MTTADTLDRGRECFGRRAWADAFVELSAADRETPLAPEDLERLATAAYLVGRDADSDEVWGAPIRSGCGWAARSVPPGARSGWAYPRLPCVPLVAAVWAAAVWRRADGLGFGRIQG
jgi:hypothetical protein